MKNYTYKCPICEHEQSVNSEYSNDHVYCIECSGTLTSVLMDKISDNTDVNVQLLLEDDHK